MPPPPPPPSSGKGEDDEDEDGPVVVDPPRDIQPLDGVKPPYPPQLKRLGISGRVKVRLTVSKDGTVENVEVLESEPKRPRDKSGPFDKTVIDGVKKWHFPKYRNSYLVDQEVIYKITDN